MSTDYNYDEQGQFFPYFILTIAGLITVPLSYSLLKPSKDLEITAPRIKSDFKPRDEDLIQGQKRKQWRRERRIKRIITVAVGYLVIAWMAYLIMVTKTTAPKIWDPYNILDISRSSSEQQIKRRFKDLSRKFHPDKAQVDESKNQTVESVNDYWVEISKAYKALTDEEVRNNFIQYGHPDGKQSFSIGIALPKFIITDGNGKYVLLVYGLLLGVLLPYVVGKWWYGTQRMTREKVLIASASSLFREYKEELSEGDVINALSSGEEFKEILSGNKVDSGLGKIEKSITEGGDTDFTAAGLTNADRQHLEKLDGARRKAFALLFAYLGRIPLDGSKLDDEKYEVAPVALALNESLTAICLAFGNVPAILSTYRTSQNLIQAIAPSSSPLLQLPYITSSIASLLEGPNARHHLTIQDLMSWPEPKRRKALTDAPQNALSPSQYNSAMTVALQLPLLKVEKAFFKVMGERHIITSSLVQLVIKARVIPPGTANVPPVNELDLEDVDPDEGDLDALLGRKSKKGGDKAKQLDSGTSDPASAVATSEEVDKPLQPPLAYAPYFARDHPPHWHVFLSDSKAAKMAVPPFTLTTFNKPLFTPEGTPTFNMQTFKMQFQAPPQVGKYQFIMHLICDSYVGMDSREEITLVVEDPAKAEEGVEEDSISEPDEDSLAAQMSALKSGQPISSGTKRRSKKVETSDDDESDTEGEAGDNTSETDTDTDTDGE
ncbi:MAG: secretory subunit [Heterodermia speciosa]|uniref:Secretory subunit n=1 Tax=Heterodermia speciosa TaxID=116794 RepID=A0A8H3ISF6_9LECA|nr:MAG: secretory subunit [Heterodermia speciosa]